MVNSYLEFIINKSNALGGKAVNLGLIAITVVIIYSCSGDDGPQGEEPPGPTPIEQLFVTINADDPSAKGQAFNLDIKGQDTTFTQLGATVAANTSGNIIIGFNATDLDGSSPTGKIANSVDLVRILNKENVIKYEFSGVAASNNSSISTPSLVIDEFPHTLNIEVNTTTTRIEGFRNGNRIINEGVDQIGGANPTFYDEFETTVLDSLVFRPNFQDFQDVKFIDEEIGREKDYRIEYQRGDTNTNTTGSIAFTASLDNSPRENFRAVLTNTQTQEKDSLDTTGPQVIFEDIPTGDYTVEIKSLIDDYYANTTQNITVVAGDANGSQNIAVDGNDTQNITVIVRDFEDTSTFVSDYVITTSTGLTQTTDSEGKINFDVTTNSSFDMTGSKSGFYTKTTGNYSTPEGEFQGKYILSSQVDTTLNTTAVRKFTYNDGQQVEAEIINWYRPLRDNTEAIWNTLAIYFPEAAEREIAIEHLSNAADLLNLELRVNTDLSQFKGNPSASQIQGYSPFPGGERYVGDIETNVTSYGGTATATQGKVLENGRQISFYTSTFNLGGGDESSNHHEFTNLLNFPLINGNTTIFNGELFVTSRDESAGDNVVINDSKWDLAIMPFWIQQQRHHYTSTDSQGRLIEYSIPKNFQE